MAEDWYRRAEMAVEKGDDELAKEALSRRQAAVTKVGVSLGYTYIPLAISAYIYSFSHCTMVFCYISLSLVAIPFLLHSIT